MNSTNQSLVSCHRHNSRAVRCLAVVLEVLRSWPNCHRFAPTARVGPQWRLTRARRCRSRHDTVTCAGVEGGGRSGSTAFYRQAAAPPLCWSFFLALHFFYYYSFSFCFFVPCHSLLLLGCCSNDIVFAAAPSHSSFLP